MERDDKSRIASMMKAAGLGKPSGALREEIRLELRNAGAEPDDAVAGSWRCIEALAQALPQQFQVIARPEPKHSGHDDDQMQDAYRWIRDHFAQIVTDSPAGTVVNYTGIPAPPTAYTCVLLETWAAKPRASRDGLFREIRAVLAVSKEDTPEPQETKQPELEPLPVEYSG